MVDHWVCCLPTASCYRLLAQADVRQPIGVLCITGIPTQPTAILYRSPRPLERLFTTVMGWNHSEPQAHWIYPWITDGFYSSILYSGFSYPSVRVRNEVRQEEDESLPSDVPFVTLPLKRNLNAVVTLSEINGGGATSFNRRIGGAFGYVCLENRTQKRRVQSILRTRLFLNDTVF